MATDDVSGALVTTRVEAIVGFLDGAGIAYELVEHETAMSATAEARVARLPADQVAKTVVLRDGSAYVIAAIPASERLGLHKLRELIGATRRLRLPRRNEIAPEVPAPPGGGVAPLC